MALTIRTQTGSRATTWLPGLATESPPGTFDWPAGVAVVQGGRVTTPAYTMVVAGAPFVCYLEPTATPGVADYYLDLTGWGVPTPWPGAGVIRVAWREEADAPIVVLRTQGEGPDAP